MFLSIEILFNGDHVINWPNEAKRAMPIFFQRWNDLDVYVEDSAAHCRNLYKALLSRALPDGSRIEEIFPIGDRRAVVDAWKKDRSRKGRPRLYIVDGDIYLLSGDYVRCSKRLFVHSLYAVENYLVCKDAILELLEEENPELDAAEGARSFGYEDWISELEPLQDLFAIFSVSFMFRPELATINLGMGPFLNEDRISRAKVDAFYDTRWQLLCKTADVVAMKVALQEVRRRQASLGWWLDCVSAKDFILPLFRMRVPKKGLRMNARKFGQELRLGKLAKLDRHNDLIASMHRACSLE
ncbi:MAG TPA: DUF4435 domain-containing protein [Rhodocyclaceae bacterium]|nr:DUF4435 domain-containing protein [Rhodocyclaceae bacterium]